MKQFPKIALEIIFSESSLDARVTQKTPAKVRQQFNYCVTSCAPCKSSKHYKLREKNVWNTIMKVVLCCIYINFKCFLRASLKVLMCQFNRSWNDTWRETPSWNGTRADSAAVEMTLEVTAQIQDDWFELMASDVITHRCRQTSDFKQEIISYSLC